MRWKCTCAYDGTNFRGWQSQINHQAVQDIIEERLANIFKQFIRIYGSGRTDAGVHARGQVFHFDANWSYGPEALMRSINSRLVSSIRILKVESVNDDFHARFSGKWKRYCYYFQLYPALPFDCNYVWDILPLNFDIERLQEVLPLFEGEHDFRGFAGRVLPEENSVKCLSSVKLHKLKDRFMLEFVGSGYLYRMVRMMTGSMVMCGYGKINSEFIKKRLSLKNLTSPIVTAPARGLFLEEVFYN